MACSQCEKPYIVGLMIRPVATGKAGIGVPKDQVFPVMRQHTYNPVPWRRGDKSHIVLDEDDSNTDELDV